MSTSNTSTIIEFSIVFAVTLASRNYNCFKYVDFVKKVIQASDIAKRLGNNVVILLKDRSSVQICADLNNLELEQ